MTGVLAKLIAGLDRRPHIVRLLAVLGLAALYPASVAIGNPTFEGVATCAGSTCHGRAEGNGAVVRQDEIATWQEPSSPSGAHSRAYAVLGGRRGQQIAASLGLGNAQAAPACLGCHSTYAPASQRGAKFTLSDGVGCESCHGPSGGSWLAEHYALPATHASNVAAGLTPLENPKARANVCLDCHYGSDKPGQFVTHAMMAAGHPRVSFELDLFSALQQHHNIDADYTARKGAPGSLRFWAVGQAEAVRRATTLFAQPRFQMQGAFPQFYFYDCHSCHRTITDGPQRKLTFETNPARPIPFGNPPFNDENIIMLSAVAGALVPGEAEAFRSASREFHRAMAADPADARAAAQALATRAGSLSDRLSARGYADADAFKVIGVIAGEATAPRFTDYAGSVQAVMAVDTLLNALVREGRVTRGAAAGIRADIARAYKAVEEPNAYRPADFRSALKSAAGAIGRLQ
ncbi:multiheme c-type cytochrome [Erythrobacter sp. sf7]|uniref:Multiheme c-type cytochrome n=1 Tax=Erythrobacter fulvus TaxID=2987523 RepID=A0ABT5JMP3_9SPHN|nr:multiheme c-type cytochrome [Erythrobacter fulvus]MDC8754021.1 multiheme c-type cytochrome [Erythrobacter fulvus]